MAKSRTVLKNRSKFKATAVHAAFNANYDTIRIGRHHYDFDRYCASASISSKGYTLRKGGRAAVATGVTKEVAILFLESARDELYEQGARNGDLFVEGFNREKRKIMSSDEALEKLSSKKAN